MSWVDEAIDDIRLKHTCSEIADGIAKLISLGLPKHAIIEGLRIQVEHAFQESPRERTGNPKEHIE